MNETHEPLLASWVESAAGSDFPIQNLPFGVFSRRGDSQSQRVGVAIVAIGIIASCITWAYSLLLATFAVLFATALVDVVLYWIVPDALTCYRCGAIYRTADGTGRHGPFNLETHERHRQQAARMAG